MASSSSYVQPLTKEQDDFLRQVWQDAQPSRWKTGDDFPTFVADLMEGYDNPGITQDQLDEFVTELAEGLRCSGCATDEGVSEGGECGECSLDGEG
ncbi:hypothetical protein GTQ99_00610 [Kineococcus sp. T13]|uniref:hypothetical protein n=1 Tax=Kineococcus vitellinus TaxID=2696565 RepID=UPI001411CE9D|nr:hypothetical protein [Kineococcus vitellinus]NAZ73933.1 hypothetical protein [Kineococcus vitellinus]